MAYDATPHGSLLAARPMIVHAGPFRSDVVCFHPNDLPSLVDGTFPHDEVKLTGHKKLTFGVAKGVLVSTLLFKDYMVNFTHFSQTCY